MKSVRLMCLFVRVRACVRECVFRRLFTVTIFDNLIIMHENVWCTKILIPTPKYTILFPFNAHCVYFLTFGTFVNFTFELQSQLFVLRLRYICKFRSSFYVYQVCYDFYTPLLVLRLLYITLR